jgi:signal transduction histidine kinase
MDELRTQLLNTVSHELSTPLTPISLQLQMLRTRGDLNDRQRKTLSIVDRNLERLAGLVKEIVDVARLQTGKLPVQREDLDLAEIVRDAGESFGEAAKHAGVGLDVRAVQPLPISGDPQRLEQVLFNLLSNAIKFTPPGGSVTVEAISERGEAIVVTRDTGVGFSAEQRDRLFQPFSQLHQNPALIRGGTGLGLYISKGIIEEHGGSIQCESAGPGQGSAFRFSLPLRAEAPPPPSPDAARLPPA